MKTFDVCVNYFGGGMELVTLEAKSRLDAIERVAKQVKAKQKVTCVYREVESMSVQIGRPM